MAKTSFERDFECSTNHGIVAETAYVEKDDELLMAPCVKRITFSGYFPGSACVDGSVLRVRFTASNGREWYAKGAAEILEAEMLGVMLFVIRAEFAPATFGGTCAITYAQLEYKGEPVTGAVVNFGRCGTEELVADDLAIIPNYTLEKGEHAYYQREMDKRSLKNSIY